MRTKSAYRKTHFTLAPIVLAPGWVTGPAECGAQLKTASGHMPKVTDLPDFVSCKQCLAKRVARVNGLAPVPQLGDLIPGVKAGAWGERYVVQRLPGSLAFYIIDSRTCRIIGSREDVHAAATFAHAKNEADVETIKETPAEPAATATGTTRLTLHADEASQLLMVLQRLAAECGLSRPLEAVERRLANALARQHDLAESLRRCTGATAVTVHDSGATATSTGGGQ